MSEKITINLTKKTVVSPFSARETYAQLKQFWLEDNQLIKFHFPMLFISTTTGEAKARNGWEVSCQGELLESYYEKA